jgi:hypothetical protein
MNSSLEPPRTTASLRIKGKEAGMLTPERIRELWENYSPTKGIESFARAIEAEVRKQDEALIQQLVEALERAKKHHSTTSLPLVIENYGSRVKCANEGSIVWRGLVPSAITAALARLGEKT